MGEQATRLPMELDEMVPTIEKIKLTIIMMEQRFSQMRRVLEEKDNELKAREEKLEEQVKRISQLESEYTSVQGELNKISSLYKEVSGKSQDAAAVRKILGIYVTLLEKVFEGKPHAKTLFLLHGEKNEMSRQELTMSTGFNPAIVLHSIHELASADLVTYDEDSGIVKLKERIYD